MSIYSSNENGTQRIQAVNEPHPYEVNLLTTLVAIATFLALTAAGGYGLNWLWTGYQGNTLWDWLKLLLMPVALAAATLFFTSDRKWRREWTILFAALALVLLVLALGGYGLNWKWTGFQGNKLWDWLKLFLQPVGLAALSIFFAAKQKWQEKWTLLVVVISVFLLVSAIGSYVFNWNWTGFEGNRLWEWINLLLLPVTLAVALVAFKGYERIWTAAIIATTIFLLIAAIGGYAFNWSWTGFQGNTLWDWLKLLVLPVAFVVVKPSFDTYRTQFLVVLGAVTLFMLIAIIGGYAFNWSWTGFQGNHLWDWLKLLVLPIGLTAAQLSFRSSPRKKSAAQTNEEVVPASSPEAVLMLADKNTASAPDSSQSSSGEETTQLLPTAPPSSLPPDGHRKKLLTRIGIAVLLTALLSLGLGVLLASLPTTPQVSTTGTSIVGHASFFSSRQLNDHGRVSSSDGLRVQLDSIPDPSSGNRYYAWLQDNQTETISLPLGVLNVNHGVATLSYIDAQHRDLLATTSNFLITEETASVTPNNPSLDKGQWRYYGTLPQTRSTKDNFSYLDHIRHLLSSEPTLEHLHLHGGVDFWFFNNIETMNQEGVEVRDHVSLHTVRQQLANILYTLDGPCAAQDLSNAQGATIPGNDTIAHDTRVGLLDCVQAPEPPGHLTHLQRHLAGIAQSVGVTPDQVKQAIKINSDLNNVQAILEQIGTDAKQLAAMNDDQLRQAHDLRADIATQTGYLVASQANPNSKTTNVSVLQITDEIESLASFALSLYKR